MVAISDNWLVRNLIFNTFLKWPLSFFLGLHISRPVKILPNKKWLIGVNMQHCLRAVVSGLSWTLLFGKLIWLVRTARQIISKHIYGNYTYITAKQRKIGNWNGFHVVLKLKYPKTSYNSGTWLLKQSFHITVYTGKWWRLYDNACMRTL